jgi:DNA-binding response OmpR family regulator
LTRPALVRGSETIVLVEDDASVRSVIARALLRAGYCVLAASDGTEALESAVRAPSPVDLVISDVVMPGVSGPTVADAMRKLFANVKVLYVSGYTRDAMALRGVIDEGVEVVQKPFTADILLARVRSILDAP